MRTRALALVVWAASCGVATAQRAGENVVRQADDAFGLSVGNDRFGLYTDDNVRGFSPSVAGNVRMEGLYFDRRGAISGRAVTSAAIRVGLTAQGYDFPAPTGIVDYALRTPSGAGVTSGLLSASSWGGASFEIDTDLRLTKNLNLGLGVSGARSPLASGVTRGVTSFGILAAWAPRPGLSLTPFYNLIEVHGEEAAPLVFTAGAFLPPRLGRRFYGQDWAVSGSRVETAGLIGAATLPGGYRIRSGLFFSGVTLSPSFTDLRFGADPEGLATTLISSFPRQRFTSVSGEVRVLKTIAEGPRHHTALISVRGRDRRSRFGGDMAMAFGRRAIGDDTPLPEPSFTYGPRTFEDVRQVNIGASYQGVWTGVGELNAGLQRATYNRSFQPGGGVAASTQRSRLLWNLNAAAYARAWLTIFAGYTRGLEDGGFAPANARNANEALPASLSTQADGGVRISPGGVKLVASVFQIEKPYYAVGPNGLFAPVGQTRSRGIEFSATTAPIHGLRLVGGFVLARPRVTGLPGLGNRAFTPIGALVQQYRLAADYSPPALPRWSLDGAVNAYGRRAARIDDTLYIPAYATVDIGARYRFKVAGRSSVARVSVTNALDQRSWAVTNGGGFLEVDQRRLTASLVTDF